MSHGQNDWVLLAYRLPREPSTPRIALWRRLRRLGAAQLSDGLVALPRTGQTLEQLEWLAGDVHEAGGEATIWRATHGSGAQRRALEARMASTVAAEYEAVVEAARAARAHDGRNRRSALARLRRTLRVIRARDYFPPPERKLAEEAVEQLASVVEVTP